MAAVSILQQTAGSRPPQELATVFSVEQRYTARRPLGEELRLALASDDPSYTWLWCAPAGRAYAGMLPGSTPRQLELTADPRQPEPATELLATITQGLSTGVLWTHGDLAAGRQAAVALQLHQERELWLMQRELSTTAASKPPTDVQFRTFNANRDSEMLLALNREIFVDLPDQGSWGPAELQLRLDAPWFDPAGLILAERSGELVGFHWTKLERQQPQPPAGEVYVLGVAASHRGSGLADSLLTTGLDYLHQQGARAVHLFVDGANQSAIDLYLRAGFAHIDTDRQFSW
ncbi:MAG: mycothiol synthase [Actinomycetia bacterium]|nr:mycothiol synthase [Actinomycetes bacterium]MCH9801391.1 mycothiol synthase [Actinomycetes bacterium]